jgi:hypothetical protein
MEDTDNTTDFHTTITVAVDQETDERGNVLAFACLTDQRRIALTMNAN